MQPDMRKLGLFTQSILKYVYTSLFKILDSFEKLFINGLVQGCDNLA